MPDRVICGDALDVLRTLPAQAASCVVTSPPYFRQRAYEAPGEIGAEASAEEYVERLVAVFRECRRVLADTGTLWLNLGDKYDAGHLLGLPWRVALALQADGWILRADVIWHKPNAMPLTVKDRPTVDHEYVFLLAKQLDYHYDQDAIREPHRTFSAESRMRGGRNHFARAGGTPERGKLGGTSFLHDGRWDKAFNPKGRNRRTVWEIPLSKFRGAHFAVFPEELVRRCILAGAPEGGVVLDPFVGSGTTLLVARELGREGWGIDASERYCALARDRLAALG